MCLSTYVVLFDIGLVVFSAGSTDSVKHCRPEVSLMFLKELELLHSYKMPWRSRNKHILIYKYNIEYIMTVYKE